MVRQELACFVHLAFGYVMLCLSAKSIMFVNVVFAVCTSVGGVMSEKAASV